LIDNCGLSDLLCYYFIDEILKQRFIMVEWKIKYFILKYDKFIRLSFEMKIIDPWNSFFFDLHTTMLMSVALEI